VKYDFIIVGAGFAGCVLAERIANDMGKKVLVIEKRKHWGGNCYDMIDSHGILIHNYGPHIFHTIKKNVWNYLTGFTEWYYYQHKVLGYIDGQYVPIPFNLNSLHQSFPKNTAQELEEKLVKKFGMGNKIPILQLKDAGGELKFLADYIYEKVFLNYTMKQWDCKPNEIDESVTGRVPVHISRDDRYFQDIYQGMPSNGYSNIFEKMLSHDNIHLLLNTNASDIIEIRDRDVYMMGEKFGGVFIYTGPIDHLFKYKYGKLPYRSLKLDFEYLPQQQYQPVGTVNYPNDYDFTRITEFKHLTGQKVEGTTILKEYSQPYDPEIKGRDIPYYIISKPENLELYKKYKNEVDRLNKTILVGRLAEYKYYNMDDIIARSLEIFENDIEK